MKLYLSIAIGLLSSLSLSALASESDSSLIMRAAPPTCEPEDASCVIMTQDQSFELAEFGAINFIGIPEDSRCPIDAVCVWAGRVRVELKHDAMSASEKFEVGLGGDLTPRWTDSRTGLVLSLEQVWPEKELAVETQEPYRIKLKVESSGTNGNAPEASVPEQADQPTKSSESLPSIQQEDSTQQDLTDQQTRS